MSSTGPLSSETWLGTVEVAERLGCSPATVVRRVRSGEIPARSEGAGQRYLIAKSAVDEMLRVAQEHEAPGFVDNHDHEHSHNDQVTSTESFRGAFDDLRPLMTVAEVAEYLGASPGQVRQMLNLGQLASVPYGKQRRVTAHGLRRYLLGQAA